MRTTTSIKENGQPAEEVRVPFSVVFYRRRHFRLFKVDGFVQEIALLLSQIVPTRSVVESARLAAYLLIDYEGIRKAFAGFKAYVGEVAGRAGAVSVSGRVVPIDSGEERQREGCALVSISVQGRRSGIEAPNSMQGTSLKQALGSIGKVVKVHNGSLRTLIRWGEARFDMYLPVLQV